MKNKLKNIILLGVMLTSVSSFAINYVPRLIKIKGELIDIASNLPIKKTKVYASINYLDDLEEPKPDLHENSMTDEHGKFQFKLYVDAKKPTFSLKIEGAAQIHFKNVPLKDETLDLGKVYAVFYDNELKEERHNLPASTEKLIAKREGKEKRRQKKSKRKIHTVSEVIDIFQGENLSFQMTLNPVDTAGPYISRLNFGPEKPRGTIVQNYIRISFTRDFAKAKNEGLTEIIRYNQRELYVKHQIDSFLIKKYTIQNEDTLFTGSTKKYVNSAGYVIEVIEHCDNETIKYHEKNDSIGRQIWATVTNYNCDGKPNGHVETRYGPYGPLKKESYFFDGLLGASWIWTYDSLGREIEYQLNGFFSPTETKYTQYFNQGDSVITLRVKANGDTLTERIVNHKNGREYRNRVYSNDTLVSQTVTKYYTDGKIFNISTFDYRKDIQIRDDYFYYKTPHKRTSQKTLLNLADKKYRFTRFRYNDQGFLIQEECEAIETDPGYYYQYEYFPSID